jgi:hypothetical protein
MNNPKNHGQLQASVRLIAFAESEEETEDLLEAAGAPSTDTMLDFHTVVSQHLAPAIESARRQIEGAVKVTSAKLRAWALLHLQQAQKLRRPTDLFEKILNDPMAATQQLAQRLMGNDLDLTPPKPKAPRSTDDILDDLIL